MTSIRSEHISIALFLPVVLSDPETIQIADYSWILDVDKIRVSVVLNMTIGSVYRAAENLESAQIRSCILSYSSTCIGNHASGSIVVGLEGIKENKIAYLV
ncbi:unnamed protein product [Anisakis simplex]|uniref:WS_DGAT_C domain-containing protein n=1 Tax=Anisakis simplex TaxID=6269 RepID=A0A0M3J6J6_ANISI|nr:unnamed protein product [Anisakis simplex]